MDKAKSYLSSLDRKCRKNRRDDKKMGKNHFPPKILTKDDPISIKDTPFCEEIIFQGSIVMIILFCFVIAL